MNILISAYACSPVQGSEAGVGWGIISALAKKHQLWVIVEADKFQLEIEDYLKKHPEFGSKVTFYFVRKRRNKILRKIWPPSYYYYYKEWHKSAYLISQKILKSVQIDLVHQLTMVGFREPGYLWKLDVPFVWGPIGGMGYFPLRFYKLLNAYDIFYYAFYNLTNLLHMKYLKRPRLAAQRAGCGLIAATFENKQGALMYWGCHSTLLTEVGVPHVIYNYAPVRRNIEMPLRIVWTGLHLPRKALTLGLDALAQIKDCNWQFNILGDGPQNKAWKNHAVNQGISDRCFFHGWLSREKALEIMSNSHVMLITSLRDLTSSVTIEALSLGLPIVCLDHCGFSSVIDESCGIKVSVNSLRNTITEISDSLKKLCLDENFRMQLSAGAFERSKAFEWDQKVKVIEEVYTNKLLKDHDEDIISA